VERVFVMPDLGEGLEEGTIVEWLVAAGDEVALNQPLVEVETAKAAVEIPSPFAGVVATLHGDSGQDVPVGAPLVTFEVVGEATTAPGTASLAASQLGPDGPGSPSPPPVPVFSDPTRRAAQRAKATPAVRALAKELGVDLDGLTGTGPQGRITEDDVRRDAPLHAMPYMDIEENSRQNLTGRRAEIADVLTRQARVPQVTTFRTVDCTALQSLRDEIGLSLLPVFIAALVRTLAEHPRLNDGWVGDNVIERRKNVNVGVAVDTDGGLVVPVIANADALGMAQISVEIRRLAEAAREGKLRRDDLAGATIAVSNTGSYGSEAGTPILSPGTSVTVALGVIQPRALVVGGEVVARPAATISLTFDHRVLDGATVGRALTDLVALLESPERLGGLPR
jgi:pyruvate dehydrogenase E2 component (dihydrolipoamide acetyltransferase)